MANPADHPAKTVEVEQLRFNQGTLIEDIDLNELDLYDQTFAVSAEDRGDHLLTESLRADGQLDPIIVRKNDDRWQVVDGFRRVRAALTLGLDKLKARRFDLLSPAEAALWVVRHLTVRSPDPDKLDELAARLRGLGYDDAADIVARYIGLAFPAEGVEAEGEGEDDAATSPEVSAEGGEADEDDQPVEEEITVDELASRALVQLSDLSQDLALVQENWADVPAETRAQVVEHLKYFAALVDYLG